MNNICVFAGTSEGRRLIERLSGRGVHITACTATEYGGELIGELTDVTVSAERLDRGQMEALFKGGGFDLVVDATHPYAAEATANIAAACKAAGVEYMRLQRGSEADAADGAFVTDAAECAAYLSGTEGNILLTTGSKELSAFCADEALRRRIYARVLPLESSLKACAACGIPADHIIAMQGPFSEDMNAALLRAVNAAYLVTKDTGSAGGYAAKISAARRTGAKAVIIGRPPQTEGVSVEQAVSELERRFGLKPRQRRVTLAGIGMGSLEMRTLGLERALREADCLIGARRMLDSVNADGRRTYTAIRAGEIADFIATNADYSRFVVLLSGDTGFYSGAKGIIEALSGVEGIETEVLAGIGSLQYFCARLQRQWEDVRCVSLHGRECNLVAEVRSHPAVFALLGGSNGAASALERLIDAGLGELSVNVGERLSYADERITRGTARELAGREFDPLSVLLIENPNCYNAPVTYGLDDDEFERDETPMTKSEVRGASLSKLKLTRGAVVYDIGSGSGSVTVEAARIADKGHVYAIEVKEKAAALTRVNVAKFGLTNVDVIEGSAPEALNGLPAPTHAFIGGSSGNMRPIIGALLALNPHVRIVANAVTLESVAELSAISNEFEYSDVCELSVSRARKLGRYRLMTAQNAVYIFTMQKSV